MNLELKYAYDEITALKLAYPELADDDNLRADMIEGCTSMDDVLRNVLKAIGRKEAHRDALGLYIEDLKMRRGRMENSVEGMRRSIFKLMQHAELKKRELPEATLSIRNGAAKVIIIDEQQIPIDFMRIRKEPDKTRIKAALQAHEHVPGTMLSNGEQTLAILTR